MAFNEHSNNSSNSSIPLNNVSSRTESVPDYDNIDNLYFGDTPRVSNAPEGTNRMPSNYANRIHSIHRNEIYTPQSRNLVQAYEARTGGLNGRTTERNRRTGEVTPLENHANLIVSKMEQDATLMEDSPTSEQLRREALRDMPQCLTIKRCVKTKLSKSVSQKSKRKPLSCYKMLKYRMSMAASKFKINMKNLAYTFELWYGPMKQIEGNFGTGVATFFKFLRWLFLMNFGVAIVALAFVVTPQIVYNISKTIVASNKFGWDDIFTGEGYFTNTILYYGFYSDQSVSVLNLPYSMPEAYFFTMVSIYFICFAVLSFSVARSYRRSFIETEGGLKNVYAHKIFCGWDYNIATKDAAKLKSRAIYNELKELLSDSAKHKYKDTFLVVFWTRTMQVIINVIVLFLLASTGYCMWKLLEKATNYERATLAVATAVIVNVIMTVLPMLFSFIVRYEGYKSPKKMLYFTLARTFLLGFVTIGVLVTYWLKNPANNSCWETSLGQEIFRLVLFDFVFSVVCSSLFDVILYGLYRWSKKGYLEFDIARNTIAIIYNQTLFWVGLFFSPLLPVIVVVKLFFSWYIRQFIVIKLCKPSPRSWRAAQTSTWFLMMTCLSLLLVGGLLGYIASYIPVSKTCGPFVNYDYMYEIVTIGVLKLQKDNKIWKVLLYVTKPGFIALVIIGLCGRVYYLRAKAQAQRGIVAIYRDMLVWESKDKEFLLQNISRVTKGQWQYRLQDGRELDPYHSVPEMGRYKMAEFGDSIHRGPLSSNNLLSTVSSVSLEPSSSAMSVDSELDARLYSRYKKVT